MSAREIIADYLIDTPLDRLTVGTPQTLFAAAAGNPTGIATGAAQPFIALPTLNDLREGLWFEFIGWDVEFDGGAGIEIVETLLGITDFNGNLIMSLGTFTPTTLAVDTNPGAVFTLPKPVITSGFLNRMAKARSIPDLFGAGEQPLQLLSSVVCSATTASEFTLNATCSVAVIGGLTGADGE